MRRLQFGAWQTEQNDSCRTVNWAPVTSDYASWHDLLDTLTAVTSVWTAPSSTIVVLGTGQPKTRCSVHTVLAGSPSPEHCPTAWLSCPCQVVDPVTRRVLQPTSDSTTLSRRNRQRTAIKWLPEKDRKQVKDLSGRESSSNEPGTQATKANGKWNQWWPNIGR